MKKLISIFLIVLLLVACVQEPDFIKDGKGYVIRQRCTSWHTEDKWGYHYGINPMNLKYEYHYGHYTETECDYVVYDTIEIKK